MIAEAALVAILAGVVLASDGFEATGAGTLALGIFLGVGAFLL